MEPIVARKTWRTLEPIHGVIYFAPEAAPAYAALGLDGQQGYFASRSAAMGTVGPGTVAATFFNFNPHVVHAALPSAWEKASPKQVLAARYGAADAILRRVLGDGVATPEVAEAARLAREAAEACGPAAGRALYAAHAELAWPEDDHLVLWHAQTLLREFRGDAHVALLTAAGWTACETLAMHAATGEVPAAMLRATRGWPDEDWDGAVADLRARGWLAADGTLTETGRAERQAIEDRTDALAVAPYEALGEDGCERLRTLCRPISKAIVEAGGLPGR